MSRYAARDPPYLDPDVLDVDQDPDGADLAVLRPSIGESVAFGPGRFGSGLGLPEIEDDDRALHWPDGPEFYDLLMEDVRGYGDMEFAIDKLAARAAFRQICKASGMTPTLHHGEASTPRTSICR